MIVEDDEDLPELMRTMAERLIVMAQKLDVEVQRRKAQ